MNTKTQLNKQHQPQQRQMDQQKQGSKQSGENPNKLQDLKAHEHERPELRLTR